MKSVFVVTEISDEKITVSECLCKTVPESESASAANIQVCNPKRFEIQVGTKVRVGFSRSMEGLQGIAALLIPVLCCAAGVFVSPFVFRAAGVEPTDFLRFACAGFIFLAAFAVVIKLSRSTYTVITPRITGLC